MKRDDLRNLGLTDDQIDRVMALNGQDIEGFKTRITGLESERDSFKDQVSAANSTINDLKKSNKDIEDVQKKADEWESKFKEAEKARDLAVKDSRLNLKLSIVGANDVDILKGLINLDGLKFTDTEILGLDEQIKALKESKGFLFKSVGDDRFEHHFPENGDGDGALSQMALEIDSVFDNN